MSVHCYICIKSSYVLLCAGQIADEIRHLLDQNTATIPSVLEIPSKEHPYDPSKDSILRRAKVVSCV